MDENKEEMLEGELNIYPKENPRGVRKKSQLLRKRKPEGSKREKRLTIIPK